jgi:cellulose synthase operon protein C
MPRPVDPRLRAVALAALLVATSAGGLSGCSGLFKGRPEAGTEPTLASLEGREVAVNRDQRIETRTADAIAAYRRFLETAPAARVAPQRAEAMRRLGDLEMERAEAAAADIDAGRDGRADPRADPNAGPAPDYRAAIAHYEALLKEQPEAPGNDRVLYQLARAQELSGQPELALRTLDRLVAEHPDTAARAEAQFRRGELLFNQRDHARAEKAYATVLAQADAADHGLYADRARYMLGWSLFKQGRLDEGLAAFFGVLDRHAQALASDDGMASLSRADRELVEDTFRVTSLSLANLQGAESIPPRITSDARRGYEFRVYQELAELYIRQERVKDAADAYGAFTRRHPNHAQAPQMQSRVIAIHEQGGFANLALDAKRDYVVRYGVKSEFRTLEPQGWAKAQPLVKTHLAELARHHHALAQKNRSRDDVQQAIRWYGEIIAAYPGEPEAAQNHFLLAELLFEDQRFADAAAAFEQAAYGYPHHAKSAEAGYAAVLAHDRVARSTPPGTAATQAGVDSALRFAQTFPDDARIAAVLTNTTEALYALKDNGRAAEIARRVVALNQPAPTADQRRIAWTVIGHEAFERKDPVAAEQAYAEALSLASTDGSPRNTTRQDLADRLAAAVYQQGEAAKAAGQAAAALGHFARVGALAPTSGVRANADLDAATALIELKDWPRAAQSLEDFRRRWPQHPLAAEVAPKLAVVYLEQQRFGEAAAEFERVAGNSRDPELARSARWQAAELHEKAGARSRAAEAWERYARQHAAPLEPNLEARWRLARIARADGQSAREQALMREIADADARAGSARTPRTRALGGLATLALTEPRLEAYRRVALTEPLQRNLALKKARMQEVLQAYAAASESGLPEVMTAATFRTAALYQDFGKALMNSQRPKRLSRSELEQYNVMLEEQAFPFEEKAIELHEANARRAPQGLYDEWVQRSFEALAALEPVRWGKGERGEMSSPRPSADLIARLESAVQGTAAAATTRARDWNQLGIAYRQAGRFADARKAYERAIELDARHAPPVLNLAILNDLYLGQPALALPLYERYAALVPGESQVVGRWIAELRNRKPAAKAANPSIGVAAAIKELP